MPNINQDGWLNYFVVNMSHEDYIDQEWVRQVLKITDQIKSEFNVGKYRGALFHLNFEANEKIKKQSRQTKAGLGAADQSDSSGIKVNTSMKLGEIFA